MIKNILTQVLFTFIFFISIGLGYGFNMKTWWISLFLEFVVAIYIGFVKKSQNSDFNN